ncbi:MAG: monovalent cation/H+ antiporter complex subunit F, partial [Brachybacterium sp.]
MSSFEIVLVVFAVVLAGAALAVVYRMIVGPTILDRALASDSLVTLVVMGMALYAAQSRAMWAGPAMLGMTGLAFIGTVTFARFVAREEPGQGIRRRGVEPAADTAPH